MKTGVQSIYKPLKRLDSGFRRNDQKGNYQTFYEAINLMDSPKVTLQFWMADRLGWTQMGPMIIEESLEEGDSLRSLLNRLAGRFREFPEAVFDPETQSLSSEVAVVINDQVQNLSQGLETRLTPGDRVLFLPILAGG